MRFLGYIILVLTSPKTLGASSYELSGSFPKNFAKLLPEVTKNDLREIKVGYSLFAKPWVQAPSSTIRRDGIGPHFNAVSCMSCHDGMGRGAPPGVRHFNEPSLLFKSNSKKLKNLYGEQVSPKALPGITPEALVTIVTTVFGPHKLSKPTYFIGHKERALSPRVSPHLAGLGLLEKINESEIIGNATRSKGRVSYIAGEVARFGWKASQVDLAHQVAGAFANDMGITSDQFPNEKCNQEDQGCLDAISGADEEGVEIRKDHLGFVVKLMRSIDAPIAIRPLDKSQRGLKVFNDIKCASCHRPEYKLENGRSITPFSDLLLHDMGEELSDLEEENDPQENSRFWRTPPLWGLGSQKLVNGHTRLMHDGRAKNVKEAILWHYGEARQSRKMFLKLPNELQQVLIDFVETR